jgi:hypothetical protein
VPLVDFIPSHPSLDHHVFPLFARLFQCLHDSDAIELEAPATVFLGVYHELVVFFAENGRFFTPKVAISILSHSQSALLHFDTNVVRFMEVCKFMDFADWRIYLHVLSTSLFTTISRTEKPFLDPGAGEDPFSIDFLRPETFTLTQTFPDGLDVVTEKNFPDSINLRSIFESDVRLLQNIESIVQILQAPEVARDFVSHFLMLAKTDFQSVHVYDYCAAFVLLYQEAKLSSGTCFFLLSTRTLFSPRFTIFGSIAEQLSGLRSRAFECLANADVEATLDFLSFSIQYPLLYAETIIRLDRFSPLVVNHVPSVTRAVLEPLVRYRGFISHPEVVKARTAIIIFIHDSFQITALRTAFLSNSEFVKTFAELGFEVQLRPQFLDIARFFLTDPRIPSYETFVMGTAALFTSGDLELSLELLRICHQFQLIHRNYEILKNVTIRCAGFWYPHNQRKYTGHISMNFSCSFRRRARTTISRRMPSRH